MSAARSVPEHPPSTTRRAGRTLRRLAILLVAAFGTTAALAASAEAQSDPTDLQVEDVTGYAEATLTDGAIVQYIGDGNTTYGSSGSGTFDSFVRIQGDGTEAGYNTDATPDLDTKSGNFTHSILWSEIPTITIGGVTYYEFWADVNEANRADVSTLSLDDVELWTTGDPSLTGYDFGGTDAALAYDWSGAILMNDVNQGSGRGDLRYLVPVDAVSGVDADCNYGSTTCDQYLVMYSAWGGYNDSFTNDSGFEEWKVKRYPTLTVAKTIEGTYDQTIDWTVTKDDDGTYEGWIGEDLGPHTYTVSATAELSAPTNTRITGTVTVTNTSDDDLVVELADYFNGSGVTTDITTDCGDSVDLAAGASIDCAYDEPVDSPVDGTNEATGTITVDDVDVVYVGSATITAVEYTATVTNPEAETIAITDDNGTPDDPADDQTWTADQTDGLETTYKAPIACPSDGDVYEDGRYELTVINTATATAGETVVSSDTAAVTITCWRLSAAKTAVVGFNRDYDWTVNKEVSVDGGTEWSDAATVDDVLTGSSVPVQWRLTAERSEPTDGDHTVSGVITITNPRDVAVDATVGESIDGATVDCGDGTAQVSVPAESSAECSYTAALADGSAFTNTATVTTAHGEYTATAEVDFDGVDPSTITDETARLVDEPLAVDEDLSDGRSITVEADAACGETLNTVTLTPADSTEIEASATVTVNCVTPSVTKTVTTTYTRTHDWDLTKQAVYSDLAPIDEAGLTLSAGQPYQLLWELSATPTGFVDSDHVVSGEITVVNPTSAPLEVTVTDTLTLGGTEEPVTVDCGDGTAVVTVAADDSATCVYEATPADSDGGENIATATWAEGPDGSVDSPPVTVLFGPPTTEVDYAVEVWDTGVDPAVLLGVAEADQGRASFYYNQPLGVGGLVLECGETLLTNSGEIRSLERATLGLALATVEADLTVTIACTTGCTLTQGYWRTHNPAFAAAHNGGGPVADEAWNDLGDVDGDGTVEGADEMFPYGGTELTYYQVMSEPPKGRVWFQVAHQYIAATLNVTNGADDTAIADTLAEAEAFLENVDTNERSKTIRSTGVELNETLTAYNEGEIGPGHCDEDASSQA